MNYQQISDLVHHAALSTPPAKVTFFKTGPGHYAEHDKFIGVNIPTLRIIAQQFATLPRTELQLLLASPFNEERLLALFILTHQYAKGNAQLKEELYQFYMSNLRYVNNWNLVDSSAHLILGAHIINGPKDILLTLAQSDVLWERRIAMVATWQFIRNNQCEWTYKLTELLLNDTHDLMHKAVGWMLREAGKRDTTALVEFLNLHAHHMPRTMLRYAIEKFPENERKAFLQK